MSSELDRLLREASAALGCSEVQILCFCSNLEGVYAVRENDQLVITDRGSTYQYYLGLDDDPTYVGLPDEAAAREICRQYGVDLETSDPKLVPRIQRRLRPSDDLPGVVAAVAAAVDAIASAATRPDLRWPPDDASGAVPPD